MTHKADEETLKWLLKKQRKPYPFVTYRGARVEAELNIIIPLEEIAVHFGVDELIIDGKRWIRNKNRSVPDKDEY